MAEKLDQSPFVEGGFFSGVFHDFQCWVFCLLPYWVKDARFLQLDVKHSGRITHKIIAEMTIEKWLDPDRQEELKESLLAMATSHDWSLEGREIGEILYAPKREGGSLVDSSAGLTIWEIRPA